MILQSAHALDMLYYISIQCRAQNSVFKKSQVHPGSNIFLSSFHQPSPLLYRASLQPTDQQFSHLFSQSLPSGHMGASCQSPPHSLKCLTQLPQPLSSFPQKHRSSLHGRLVSLGSALFAWPMAALKMCLPFPCPRLTSLLWSHFQLAPIISNTVCRVLLS